MARSSVTQFRICTYRQRRTGASPKKWIGERRLAWESRFDGLGAFLDAEDAAGGAPAQ